MSYYEYWRDRPIEHIDMFPHNFHWEEHLHRSVEIQCVTGAGLDATLGDEQYALKTGEVLFIASGMPHSMSDIGDNYALLVPPRYLDAYFDSVSDTHPRDPVIRGEPAKRMIELISALPQYFKASPVRLHYKLYEILDVALSNLTFVSAQKPSIARENYDIISKCMQYIDDNCTANLSLGSLASEFGYNKNYLSNVLHKELGMNFREFINQRRLDIFTENYDPELSYDTQLEKCGFNSRQTFYRAFKKHFKMTPDEYFMS